MRRDTRLRMRASHGRQLLTSFRDELSAALGVPVEPSSFLDLDVTERLKAAFFDKVKSDPGASRRTWDPADMQDVRSILTNLAAHVTGLRAVLFHHLDEYLGAALVAADIVLQRADRVWSVTKEDLSVGSMELADGLCLEFNHYGDRDEYELTTWGAFSL